jgi:Carbohydrate family 9 binding domain-like
MARSINVSIRSCLLPAGLVLLVVGCVEKDPDIPAKGRRPLTRAEKARVQKNILKAPPAKMRFRVNADLEGKLVYLGMDAPAGSVIPGKPFTVVHYWQVKQALGGWKLFLHTNGPNLSDFRNFDHTPVFGLYPVSKWKVGEIIRDRHSIVLPKNTKYKKVDFYVGIWRGGRRLKVRSGKHDGKNRVLAARIQVVRSGPPAKRARARRYLVRRASGKITLDGKGDEPDWKTAPSTGPFLSSLKGKTQLPRTEARLLWDDKYLYVLFTADDDDVWAHVKKPDDLKMWTEQVFEVYLDADASGAEYIELQVNPLGVIFDAYLPRPGQVQADWSSGLIAKVVVRGTLNKRDDKDQGWQAELAIPLAAAQGRSKAAVTLPPTVGQVWRANFFTTDRPAKGALKAWAWSPPRRPTFHAPDRFGELVFADAQGRTKGQTLKSAQPKSVQPKSVQPKSVQPKPRARTQGAKRPAGGMK